MLRRFFPLNMTAAGTVQAAEVVVLGAGVAGLQAIATARRLGAVVEAYDVRPAVKEEVKSLGATFLELELEAQEGQGGYAREQSEEFLTRQREPPFGRRRGLRTTRKPSPTAASPTCRSQALPRCSRRRRSTAPPRTRRNALAPWA